MNGIVRFAMVSALVGLVCPLLGQSNGNESQLIFETSFEVEEGYSEDADLIGQNGWIGFAGVIKLSTLSNSALLFSK